MDPLGDVILRMMCVKSDPLVGQALFLHRFHAAQKQVKGALALVGILKLHLQIHGPVCLGAKKTNDQIKELKKHLIIM